MSSSTSAARPDRATQRVIWLTLALFLSYLCVALSPPMMSIYVTTRLGGTEVRITARPATLALKQADGVRRDQACGPVPEPGYCTANCGRNGTPSPVTSL